MREDLKAALRSLWNAPSFTAVVLAVLALAIGAGTAIFSVVDAVVLRGLPFDEHDRIVAVLEQDTRRPTTFGGGAVTTQAYLDWRLLQESFEGIALAGSTHFWMKDERGEQTQVRAQRVTHEFFPTLRVAPLLGRTFTAADEIGGQGGTDQQGKVVLVSYGFWQRRFGGSPDVLGKTIVVEDGETREIVGVMPRGFEYPVGAEYATDAYVPVTFSGNDRIRAGGRNYNNRAIARLKPGVSIAQASDQMDRVAKALDAQYPTWQPGWRIQVVPLHENLVGRVRAWMLLLLGAVGFVLLIACANVANLLLARATVREREMAIRAALGASRWRLIRALLVEGLVLSLLGTLLGVALAYGGVHVLRAWLPPSVPRVAAIAIDLRVLGATIAAAVLTGIVFGLVPAIQGARPALTQALKEGGRSVASGMVGQRLRSLLVIVEVALAVVLLVGAALFIGSFIKLMQVDPGLDYRKLLVLNAGMSFKGVPWEEAAKRGAPYVQRMIEAVSAVPGVQGVATVSGGLPLSGNWSRTGVKLPGRAELKGDDDSIDRRTVSANYLSLLKVPLLKGRHLTAADRENAPAVVVLNEAAARKYFPGEDPLGKRITISSIERVVVGIVGNMRHLGPESPVRQEAYIPLLQDPQGWTTFVMRTAGDPMQTLPAVRAAILSVNPAQRFYTDTVTLEAYMDRLIAQRRFNMALLTLFGVVGLIIAAIGLYGVMAYVVAQRTNEIGVRMALGATPRAVVSMVLGRAAILMAVGLTVGLAGVWYLGSGVKTFLFEIEPNDPRVYLLAFGTLMAAGLVATALPARRAARVDPLIALRAE